MNDMKSVFSQVRLSCQRLFLVLTVVSCSLIVVKSQPRSTGINNKVPNLKSALDVKTSTGFKQGFLMPRLTTVDTNNIGVVLGKDKGIMFYDTTAGFVRWWDGAKWQGGNSGNNVFPWTRTGNNLYPSTLTDKVGIGTTSPNASAAMEVNSTSQGFLPPRMTNTQRDAIASPAMGLVVYNTITNCLNFYNGIAWMDVCGTLASLSISSFAPSIVASGDVVTIIGNNFTSVSDVLFNGLAAQSFTIVNSATITAVVPTGVTSGTIRVIGSNGTANSTQVFYLHGSQTFAYTGSLQTFTVPTGISSITVTLKGAGGGNAQNSVNAGAPLYLGGNGAYVQGTLSVLPESNYSIVVGGKGVTAAGGAGGGGFSGILNSSNLAVMIAGGGGGASSSGFNFGSCNTPQYTYSNGGNGSNGGGSTGSSGAGQTGNRCNTSTCAYSGLLGTIPNVTSPQFKSDGGNGGFGGGGGGSGNTGGSGGGGGCSAASSSCGSGGGGGGFVGGYGGTCASNTGGQGGSSYSDTTIGVTMTEGGGATRETNGSVVISW